MIFTVLVEDDGYGFSKSYVFDTLASAEAFRDAIWEPLTDRGWSVYHVVAQGEPHKTAEAAIQACDTLTEMREEDEDEDKPWGVKA